MQPQSPPPLTPAIRAFERLRAADGLLITEESWRRTQGYHRQRQNFYYQSLHQAGIVSGLGVSVTSAPEDIEARYRNGRWIQVQPGIAIDAAGNPIVVTEPSVFQVQSQCEDTGETQKTVFITVSYVDPDELRHPPGKDWVKELYRIVEKTSLDPLDVELCRILITPGAQSLAISANVLAPLSNTLDLTQRRQAGHRPEGVIRVAQVMPPGGEAPPAPPANGATPQQGLQYLLRAVGSLYPDLVGDEAIVPLPLDALTLDQGALLACDLVYLSYSDRERLSTTLQEALPTFVRAGGVLLIAVDGWSTPRQDELASIRRQLVAALTEVESDPSLGASRGAVQREIDAIDAERRDYLAAIEQSVRTLTETLGLSPTGSGEIAPDHLLHTTPFLFSQWPLAGEQPLHLVCWGGVVLMVGALAQQWGPDATGLRSRDTIRSAHELGINLLHYAWRRRQLMQLQISDRPPTDIDPQLSLTRQVTA